MTISSDQLRMVRGALKVSIQEFADLVGLDKMTVHRIESGYPARASTLARIKEAVANVGLEFLDPIEGVRGAGVAFKWGFDPELLKRSEDNNPVDTSGNGLHSRAWDEDFEDPIDTTELNDNERAWFNYVRTNPNLSDRGREILLKAMRQ